MLSVGFQLILAALVSLFCLFFSLIFYNIIKIQSNSYKGVGSIIPIVNESLRLYYNKIYKVSLTLFITIFVLLTFIPQYNIKFATAMILGTICALVFPIYLVKTIYFLFLCLLNKYKKNTYHFLIFITVVVIGLFSLCIPIIFCALLLFLFGDEENIKYIIGFMLGMGVAFTIIRISGIVFKQSIFYVNEKVEDLLMSMQEEKREYYNSAVRIMDNIVVDITGTCSELFDNYIFIIVGTILLASLISPSEMELLSNVSFDMRETLMFLPVALSTVVLLVFIINAFILFLFKTVKLEIILRFFLFVIFFTLVSLIFIIVFLYGLNIRVFSTYFLGSLMALAFNVIYGHLKVKNFKYDLINIFEDTFILFSILAVATILSIYIAGVYGLSMMFLGFVSFNGIFISEVIIFYIALCYNKIGQQLPYLREKLTFRIDNVFEYYEKNPYIALPYVIIQTVNTSLMLLIIFVLYNNITLVNIAAFSAIGGVLLGASIISLEFILVHIAIKKNIPFINSINFYTLKSSLNRGLNNIIDKFVMKIVDNTVKNTIVKVTILFLHLLLTVIFLFFIFNNIMSAFIIGLVCFYMCITIVLVTVDKMQDNGKNTSNIVYFKNSYSILGSDIIKFIILIILIIRFGS